MQGFGALVPVVASRTYGQMAISDIDADQLVFAVDACRECLTDRFALHTPNSRAQLSPGSQERIPSRVVLTV